MLNCIQPSVRLATEEIAETIPSVLIVDDDATAASELAETLELEGFCCIAASSPEQAVSLTQTFRSIDIIITDFYLWGNAKVARNGLVLIEQIREEFPGRAFDFIVVSGDQDVLADCVMTGAGQFLAKPIAPESICAMVRDASSQRLEKRAPEEVNDLSTPLHQMVQTQADTIARLTDALNEARTDNRKAARSLDRLVSAAMIARKSSDDAGTTDLDVLLRYVVGQGYAIKDLISSNSRVPQRTDAVTVTRIAPVIQINS